MIETAEKIYSSGKKSLDALVREKAYSETKEYLKEKGIDINDVSDEDIETLVAAKTNDMMNGIKGFGMGAALTVAISLVTGV